MTNRNKARGGVRYTTPQISIVQIRIEDGFASSSLDMDDSSIKLDGFDINNPDGNFSADE